MTVRDNLLKTFTKYPVNSGSIDTNNGERKGAVQLRALVNERLLKTIDLAAVDRMSDPELKAYLKSCIQKIVADDNNNL